MDHSPAMGMIHVLMVVVVIIAAAVAGLVKGVKGRKRRGPAPQRSDAPGSEHD